jgi:hypothetical protein
MLQPVVERQHVQADVGPYNFNPGLSEEGCRGAQEFDLAREGREGGREGGRDKVRFGECKGGRVENTQASDFPPGPPPRPLPRPPSGPPSLITSWPP